MRKRTAAGTFASVTAVAATMMGAAPAHAVPGASGYTDCSPQNKVLAMKVDWQTGSGSVPLTVHVEGDAGSTSQTSPGPAPTTIVTWHQKGTWSVDTYPTGFLISATPVCV